MTLMVMPVVTPMLNLPSTDEGTQATCAPSTVLYAHTVTFSSAHVFAPNACFTSSLYASSAPRNTLPDTGMAVLSLNTSCAAQQRSARAQVWDGSGRLTVGMRPACMHAYMLPSSL